MNKKSVLISLTLIAPLALLIGLVAFWIVHRLRPEGESAIAPKDVVRILSDSFGGDDKVPSSVVSLHAREDRNWDGSAVWMVLRVPHDQIEGVEQQIIQHYREQPQRMQ